jgi:hypothetical protein
MKRNAAANELWDPNADFSVGGIGVHPWLADLNINTIIDMSDDESEKVKKNENDS